MERLSRDVVLILGRNADDLAPWNKDFWNLGADIRRADSADAALLLFERYERRVTTVVLHGTDHDNMEVWHALRARKFRGIVAAIFADPRLRRIFELLVGGNPPAISDPIEPRRSIEIPLSVLQSQPA